MPNNFKKLVRERMLKTGESYQAAAKQVRAKGLRSKPAELAFLEGQSRLALTMAEGLLELTFDEDDPVVVAKRKAASDELHRLKSQYEKGLQALRHGRQDLSKQAQLAAEDAFQRFTRLQKELSDASIAAFERRFLAIASSR